MAVVERDIPANEVSTPGRGKVLPFFTRVIDAMLEPSRRERRRREDQIRRAYIWSRIAKLANLQKRAAEVENINLAVLQYTSREILRYFDELDKLKNLNK